MKRRYIATLMIVAMLITVFSGCISEEKKVTETPMSTTTPTPMGYSGSWIYATRFVGPDGGLYFDYEGQETCEHYFEFCAPSTPSLFKEGIYRFTLLDMSVEDCNEWYIKLVFDEVVVIDVNNSSIDTLPITSSEYALQESPFVETFLHNVESFDILVERWEENE